MIDTSKIIGMVENSETTKRFMLKAKVAAIKSGITPQEWQNAQEVLFLFSLTQCPKAIKELSEQVWEELQEEAGNQ